MTHKDIENIVNKLDQEARKTSCCCTRVPKAILTLSGVSAGETVTVTASVTKVERDCKVSILSYYWWDCMTAQEESVFLTKVFDPNDDWHNYGWRIGGSTDTQSHKGAELDFGVFDIGDTRHWEWNAGVIVRYCDHGQMRVSMSDALPIEFTWEDHFIVENGIVIKLNGNWTL